MIWLQIFYNDIREKELLWSLDEEHQKAQFKFELYNESLRNSTIHRLQIFSVRLLHVIFVYSMTGIIDDKATKFVDGWNMLLVY